MAHHHLRAFLLLSSAVLAAACGGSVTSAPEDNDAGRSTGGTGGTGGTSSAGGTGGTSSGIKCVENCARGGACCHAGQTCKLPANPSGDCVCTGKVWQCGSDPEPPPCHNEYCGQAYACCNAGDTCRPEHTTEIECTCKGSSFHCDAIGGSGGAPAKSCTCNYGSCSVKTGDPCEPSMYCDFGDSLCVPKPGIACRCVNGSTVCENNWTCPDAGAGGAGGAGGYPH